MKGIIALFLVISLLLGLGCSDVYKTVNNVYKSDEDQIRETIDNYDEYINNEDYDSLVNLFANELQQTVKNNIQYNKEKNQRVKIKTEIKDIQVVEHMVATVQVLVTETQISNENKDEEKKTYEQEFNLVKVDKDWKIGG